MSLQHFCPWVFIYLVTFQGKHTEIYKSLRALFFPHTLCKNPFSNSHTDEVRVTNVDVKYFVADFVRNLSPVKHILIQNNAIYGEYNYP